MKFSADLKRVLIIFLAMIFMISIPLSTGSPDTSAPKDARAGHFALYANATDGSAPVTSEPAVAPPKEFEKLTLDLPRSKAAMAIDAVTGDTIYSKNAEKALPAASISKLMTIWLVHEKIHKGKGSWSSKVTIRNKGIEKMSKDPYCGGYVLKVGQTYTVTQLYKLALMSSSNAAATQLGIWVSGSNQAFVKKMNSEAKKLKLTKTTFYSASGLDNDDTVQFGLKVTGGKKSANLMSAHDILILSKKLIDKYPKILKTSKLYTATVKGKKIRSSNNFLKGGFAYDKTLGIDGLKTGTTPRAGLCLVTTYKKDKKHRVITVVLHSTSRYDDSKKIIKAAQKKYPY